MTTKLPIKMLAFDDLVRFAEGIGRTRADVQASLSRSRLLMHLLQAMKEECRKGEAEGIMLGVALGAMVRLGFTDEHCLERAQQILDRARELERESQGGTA